MIRSLSRKIFTLTEQGIATLLFSGLYMACMSSVCEIFYWFSASVVYASAHLLFFVLIGLLIRLFRNEGSKKRLRIFLLLTVVCIIGANEIHLFFTLWLLLLVLLWCWYRRHEETRFLSILFAVALLCSGVSLGMTGNIKRMERGGNLSLYEAAMAVLTDAARIPGWFKNLSLWIISVLALPLCIRLANAYPVIKKHLYVHPLWFVIFWIAALLLSLFPCIYAVSYTAPRVSAAIYLIFLLGWFFSLQMTVSYLTYRFQIYLPNLPQPLMSLLILVIACKLFTAETKAGVACRDLLSGKVAEYDRANRERYAKIVRDRGAKPVIFQPLPFAETVYQADLTRDSNHWINRSFSKYYGLDSVLIE